MDNSAQTPSNSLTVVLRYEFYRDNFRRLLTLSIGLVFLLVVTVIVIYVLATRKPDVVFAAVTPDLRVVELQPLSAPYISPAGLRTWLSNSLDTIYDYNAKNYKKKLGDIEPLFTSTSAYTNYLNSLNDKRRIDYVANNGLSTSFTVTATQITGEGQKDGAYTWQLDVMGSLNYSASGHTDISQPVVLKVLVQRTDVSRNGTGIGITQILETRAH